MFERFSNEARQVVMHAQDEARALHHTWIGTEHILLGLLHANAGPVAQVLGGLGIAAADVRAEVIRIIPADQVAAEPPAGPILFTPRVKTVLVLTLRESLARGDREIRPEHILLGLAREGEGVANRILAGRGADAERIRGETLRLLPDPPRG